MISREFIYIDTKGNKRRVNLRWDIVGVIGFSGRNEVEIKKHIEELYELGIKTPKTIPVVFWVDPLSIRYSDHLYVVGDETSGEIEVFCAFDDKDNMYIAVGSDHTDRQLEKMDIHKSKQICSKIISKECWKFDDIKDHIDELILECKVQLSNNDELLLYQRGSLGQIKPLSELTEIVRNKSRDSGFCKFSFLSGTIPLIYKGRIYPTIYHMLLYDPVLDRKLEFSYKTVLL